MKETNKIGTTNVFEVRSIAEWKGRGWKNNGQVYFKQEWSKWNI